MNEIIFAASFNMPTVQPINAKYLLRCKKALIGESRKNLINKFR